VVVIDQGTDSQGGGLTAPSKKFSSNVYDALVSSLIYSKDSGDMSVSIRFKNTSDVPIALSYVRESLSVSDGNGGFMTYKGNWSGLRICNSSFYNCTSSSASRITLLAPGKLAQLNFQMEGEKALDAPKMSLTMELVVTPNTEEADTYEVQSVGFYDMETMPGSSG